MSLAARPTTLRIAANASSSADVTVKANIPVTIDRKKLLAQSGQTSRPRTVNAGRAPSPAVARPLRDGDR